MPRTRIAHDTWSFQPRNEPFNLTAAQFLHQLISNESSRTLFIKAINQVHFKTFTLNISSGNDLQVLVKESRYRKRVSKADLNHFYEDCNQDYKVLALNDSTVVVPCRNLELFDDWNSYNLADFLRKGAKSHVNLVLQKVAKESLEIINDDDPKGFLVHTQYPGILGIHFAISKVKNERTEDHDDNLFRRQNTIRTWKAKSLVLAIKRQLPFEMRLRFSKGMLEKALLSREKDSTDGCIIFQ